MRIGRGLRRAVASVLAVGLLGIAGPAAGSIVTFTYEGVVTTGLDVTGVFGRADARLADRPFTAEFVFDTSSPATSVITFPDGSAFFLTGSGHTNPLSASLTIGGVTVTFGETETGLSAVKRNDLCDLRACVFGDLQLTADNDFVHLTPFTSESNTSMLQLTATAEHLERLGLNVNFLQLPYETFSGEFSYFTQKFDGRSTSTQQAQGVLDPHSLTIAINDPSAPPPAAPEPGAWALMIVGLGAIGALARRSREAAQSFG